MTFAVGDEVLWPGAIGTDIGKVLAVTEHKDFMGGGNCHFFNCKQEPMLKVHYPGGAEYWVHSDGYKVINRKEAGK